ncbi:MAG: radical SAM/SPASM domain protein, ACGX system [Anaerovibrio sp.]|uniref:radical SAM/SPASM domain protein, ACGX system n=1 Tax=Anaerovibrio sp. TaxID=1872532 RepID=UPI0025D95EC6|nr:radical SAM/SPASM domain protein, ACGX system [Anaerovibrio sp.]MCR5176156.1 radical SAM/SPASM domain protein, ACGX system [Anaerovibrio sp.]
MKPYFSFQWHITDECDQRCKHCYIFAENTHKCPDFMNIGQMDMVLENCLDFCDTYGRQPYFYLTGGDPILHPDFWTLLDKFKEKKIPFTIMGNPFHLTEEVCKKLADCGCLRYQMSIDGTEKTHDWFRKPGSFKTTLEKVAIINGAGIRSIIMTTVSDKNIDEIPDIIDAVVAAGANVYAFARYCPTSDDKENSISPKRYRKLLEDCDNIYRSYEEEGCETYFNRKDHLWTLFDYEKGRFHIPADAEPEMIYGGCNCGNCHLTILPTGDVYACRRVQNSCVGNVFSDKLSDLWINELEQYRNYDNFKKCSKCKLLAWCRGCPAVACSSGGDFYAEDPQCWADSLEGLLIK